MRVIKLPEMVLKERSAVVEYLIDNHFNDIVDKIEKMKQAEHSRNPSYAPLLRPRLWNETLSDGITNILQDLTKFAILSHAWEHGNEPSYEDFRQKRNLHLRGYKKLQDFSNIAYQQYGAKFAWADTVCIDSSSSSELDESIRSMFAWYHASSICIIYVGGTLSLYDLPFDRWFTRGWTLQELLAPLRIKFYNKNWHPITDFPNDKIDTKEMEGFREPEYSLQFHLLGDAVLAATGINMNHIRTFKPGFHEPPLPERMRWISRRDTTRAEDKSYSMMGIFGVSISVAYGEGAERAFFRLFKAIFEVDYSLSWFLWTGKPLPSHIHPSRMIPSSAECYAFWQPEFERAVHAQRRLPISLTNIGLPMEILVVPAKLDYPRSKSIILPVPEEPCVITCPLSDDSFDTADIPHAWGGWDEFALGILNASPETARNPSLVYAILLCRHYLVDGDEYTGWKRCETNETIFFRLKKQFREVAMKDWTTVGISRREVGWEHQHGEASDPTIKFQTLYL